MSTASLIGAVGHAPHDGMRCGSEARVNQYGYRHAEHDLLIFLRRACRWEMVGLEF